MVLKNLTLEPISYIPALLLSLVHHPLKITCDPSCKGLLKSYQPHSSRNYHSLFFTMSMLLGSIYNTQPSRWNYNHSYLYTAVYLYTQHLKQQTLKIYFRKWEYPDQSWSGIKIIIVVSLKTHKKYGSFKMYQIFCMTVIQSW